MANSSDTTLIDFDALMLGELDPSILSLGVIMGTNNQENFPPDTSAPYRDKSYGTNFETLMDVSRSGLAITTETQRALAVVELVGTVDPQNVVGAVTVLEQTVVIDQNGNVNVST